MSEGNQEGEKLLSTFVDHATLAPAGALKGQTVKQSFDHDGINHMTVAINREMTPQGSKRHPESDTLFIGGPQPTKTEQSELAGFGLSKNYRIIFPSFDASNVDDGPTGFHAVVTDGSTVGYALSDGRLWKRDRRSTAILLFPELGLLLKLSAKGCLIVRDMSGRYHDHGYELAREAVVARAARKPGNAPVVSPIGTLLTVLDMRTLADTFAMAE